MRNLTFRQLCKRFSGMGRTIFRMGSWYGQGFLTGIQTSPNPAVRKHQFIWGKYCRIQRILPNRSPSVRASNGDLDLILGSNLHGGGIWRSRATCVKHLYLPRSALVTNIAKYLLRQRPKKKLSPIFDLIHFENRPPDVILLPKKQTIYILRKHLW